MSNFEELFTGPLLSLMTRFHLRIVKIQSMNSLVRLGVKEFLVSNARIFLMKILVSILSGISFLILDWNLYNGTPGV